MAIIPKNLKYSKDHEWVHIIGDIAAVGITDYAQTSLGDIVFVELPEVGSTLSQGDSFGVVESIKSVSDLYAPISGEVIERNDELEANPELCNKSPYDQAWMIKIKINNLDDTNQLLNADDYQTHCQSL